MKFDQVIVDVSGAIKPDFDLLMQQCSWLQTIIAMKEVKLKLDVLLTRANKTFFYNLCDFKDFL